MKLATILQISDLHFGDIDPTTGNAVKPKLMGMHRVIDGLLGHDINSLKRVSRFWLNLGQEGRKENVPTALVVTGDLTTVGKFDQYVNANEYLSGQLDLTSYIPHLAPLGLSVADWRNRGIPGNHDHYPGSFEPPDFMFGDPPHDMQTNFLDDYPAVSSLPLSSGHVLKFMLINTDADVWSYGVNRFFARGDFRTQLAALANHPQLGDPEKEIRVLCLHHSPAHQDFPLGIEDRSRQALNDFIVKHNVAVLLTGHKHTPPLIQIFPAQHLNISRTYLEARCGSTTQQSTPDFTTSTPTGSRPQRPEQLPNSLLVHRLYLEGTEVFWESNFYFELPTGFEEKSKFHSSKAIRSLPLAGRFKVYRLTV